MTPRFKGNIIVYSIFFIIFAIGFSNGYELFKEKLECGIVLKKLEPSVENVHKSTSTLRVEREFVMKYDNGKTKSINVGSETFYSHKEGDRCCFNERVKINFFITFCLFLSYFLIIIYSIIFFIFLCRKIIYNKPDEKISTWFLFDF